MNMLKWEFKKIKTSIILWTIAFVLLQLMYSSFFPSMTSEEGSFLAAKLKFLPKFFLKMFGMENLDITNILHYYALQGQFIIILIGSVFGAKIGAGIVVKEESEKTAEFLLSKPVTREKIITAKILTLILSIITFDGLIIIANLIFFNIFNTSEIFDFKLFWLLSLAPLLIHLIIGLISFLISTIERKLQRADAIALGITFTLYSISVLGKLTEKLNFLTFFTPYSYFDPTKIVKTTSLNFSLLLLYIVECSILISISYVIFRKKDIYL
ncbi:ABC transporter permease subunit [Thermosipho ferrireducens]|uniref:ABC transporter permease subunit n=1 Tax=Thermosipho ferrireducens TaxID=2571116 RepID=A0ABX7S9Z6_9BACT|nr:ABC transporter permease subunit [Thermosipho ferrireducens]QTA38070.1 ABC transporter permease subunit [Thermosipho ferrireducens]